MKRLYVFLIATMTISTAYSQTCCTGGTPLLGSFSPSKIAEKQLKFNYTFSLNNNHDLIAGDKELADPFLQRVVNANLLQVDYGLLPQLSVSVVIPYLFQTETIRQSNNERKFRNHGTGDISIWVNSFRNYPNIEMNFALGVKIPTGNTNASEDGVPLPLSLQVGSGSFDGSISLQSVWFPFVSKQLSFVNQIGAKINSKGRNFEAHPNYRFGHLIQWLSSVSYTYTVSRFVTNSFLGVTLQNRGMDQFDGGFENENTGGVWVNFFLGQSFSFSEKFEISINSQFPIYRDLNGFQLTSSYQGALVISYIIGKDEENSFFD